jgi:subtilisin-like proprotein convertase family protein
MNMMKAFLATATAIAVLSTASIAGAQVNTISTLGAGFSIDDLTTHTSVIAITDPAVLTGVTFSLNGLTHSYLRDLSASLTHGGTSVNWLVNSGGSADLNGNYLISDAGAATLGNASGNPRPWGTYSAFNPLSAFDGMSGAGDWTLTITDNAVEDTGNLSNWALNLSSASVVTAAPEPATWAMMIGGFGMAGGALRRRKSAVTTRVSYAV